MIKIKKEMIDIFDIISQDRPIVVTTRIYPFNIIYVNDKWTNLCGYSLKEIYGKSIFILREGVINNFIINKTKDNRMFIHFFDIYYLNNYLSLGITNNYQFI